MEHVNDLGRISPMQYLRVTKLIRLIASMHPYYEHQTLTINGIIFDAAPANPTAMLSARGYIIHPVSFSEHKKQFGGIHCSTQILSF